MSTSSPRSTMTQNKLPLGRWFRAVGWRHLIALPALLFALFPVLWVFSAAFSNATLSSQSLIPDHLTLSHFREILSDPNHPPFWTWFRNSMIISTVAAVLQVFLSACAAFAFSRLRFKGRRVGLMSLLLIQMFPNLLAFVALYLFMIRMKSMFPAIGVGSIGGLLLIYMGGALGVQTYIIKGYFDTIPYDLDEAAKIDGATHAQLFIQVILPLAKPVLAVMGLLAFIGLQADYLLASVMLGANPHKKTLAAGLSGYILEGYNNRWGPFAAGAIIAAVPVVALFLFLQRFIVSGLTAGAVKS
jgi:arabinogalactan oligomer / maltooligosaccharide transport system permease protein